MALSDTKPADRFMLWVDAVGGYWVCLADELIVGQPGDCGGADIPILADISSRHARIRRDGEGYLIDAFREVRVGGRPVDPTELLTDGSRIEIGPSVKLQMRRAHPLSLTARLDFLSRHRTQPPADAVLLLADSCVLGPRPQSHIVCRDWTREVILFRHDEKFYCHAAGYFEIDGVVCKIRGQLQANSRVIGEGFSFSLEPVERKSVVD
ncbi:MAG: FHA domain-containing protein [Planctomycetota bacterium]